LTLSKELEISATRDTTEAVYEIEKIIATRKELGKEQEYRVKWLGWNKPGDLTWEPLSNIEGRGNLAISHFMKATLANRGTQPKKRKSKATEED
jgi:Chromo (CHRromatin Organisation MOdifier) domain